MINFTHISLGMLLIIYAGIEYIKLIYINKRGARSKHFLDLTLKIALAHFEMQFWMVASMAYTTQYFITILQRQK